MKKITLYLLLLIFISESTGQQIINGDFESWKPIYTYPSGEIMYKPDNWTLYSRSSQAEYYYGDPFPSSGSGKFSMCIQSLGGSITGQGDPSFLTYGNTVGKKRDIQPKKWGVSYTTRPLKVKGEYKFYNVDHQTDAGYAYILLRKYNTETKLSDTIGFGSHTFPINATDVDPWGSIGYEPFEIDIKYKDKFTLPDTMVLVFVDSKYQEFGMNKYDGGLFFIDNVSLVESPASLSDATEAEASLTLHPNPATEILNIGNAKDYEQYIIYHSTGQKVLETKATESLDVSALPAGLYLLEAIDDKGYRVIKKFEKR